MQRYFVDQKIENKFTLNSEDSYHILKVMRMTIGDRIEIVFNEKTYICFIVCLEPHIVAEVLEEKSEMNELPISVTLVQALVKEQKMDIILQKATELGVDQMIPYQATRSVIKINQKETKKINRWQKIIKEASEQSKRTKIPKVQPVMTISDLLTLKDYDKKLLCTVQENTKNLKNLLSNVREGAKMIVVVGPEGGFTKEEEEQFIQAGFQTVSLGKSVLRTETASLFIMSAVRYHSMR